MMECISVEEVKNILMGLTSSRFLIMYLGSISIGGMLGFYLGAIVKEFYLYVRNRNNSSKPNSN